MSKLGTLNCSQWRTQDFSMEGWRRRRRRGVLGVGRGVPLPTGEGLRRGLCPFPRNFLVILVENTVF